MNKGNKLVMFPTQFEVYSEEMPEHRIAVLKAFDDQTITVTMNEQIVSPKELTDLAVKLGIATQMLQEGI